MKTENIHVAIFPIGSVIKFRKDKIKRADGSSEYLKLVWALCRQKSISKISIIQQSDWHMLTDAEKIEIDPRGILVDVYSHYKLKTPQSPGNHTTKEECYYLWDALKDTEQPDFGIGFPAQGFTINNIPQFLYGLKNPNKLNYSLNMTIRYSGPVIHYLGMSKIPWYMVSTDPRYLFKNMRRRDCGNKPLEIISQYNDSLNFNSLDYYDTQASAPETIKEINVRYTGIEKLNLVNEVIIPPDNDRPNKFSIVAMQSSWGKTDIKDYRFNVLKNWIFKYDKDQETKVYGKWADIFTKDYPQFKGYIDPTEVDELFIKTRYTLIIPIRPNWVTSKYAEMLRVGVVPFLHKDYDTQNNLVAKDHFIRVKSPEDFYEKMKFLDENPAKRIILVKNLQGKFLADTKRGKFILDIFNNANDRHGIKVNIPYNWDDTIQRKEKTKALF